MATALSRSLAVQLFFFRWLPHMEVAVCGTLPISFQNKIIAFIVVHGFMVCFLTIQNREIALFHFPMPALSVPTFKMSRSQTIQKREIALFSFSDANFEDELKSDDTKT